MDLMQFLLENDTSNITEEVTISKRIPYKFKIKALTSAKKSEFMKRCKGKMNKSGIELDTDLFSSLVCVECTLEPNFKSADAIEKKGVQLPIELLDKVLLAGEKDELYQKISVLSGFDADLSEAVEQAKN